MVEIKKGEIYEIEITGLNHEGQGVGKIEGFVVFVDNALPGELVEVEIEKITRSYAVGSLKRIAKASLQRIEPFCPVFERCGGCSIQHMSYEEQLRFKTDIVIQNIRRIAKLEDITVHPTIGMKNAFNYRNKAQFPVGMSGKEPVIGFYAMRTHNIIDSPVCGIQDAMSNKVREIVRMYIKEYGISVYEEQKHKGLLRHVMTRTGFKTKEVMVVLVINGRDIPHRKELIKILTSEIPEVKSIMLNINTQKSNIILGSESICIFGSSTITDYIGKFRFEISPLSFFQVNPVQTEVLYGKALEYSRLTGNETVFDLYCGIGTISLFLSQKAKKVYGVEVVSEAVRDARRNAAMNGVDNVEFVEGEAEKVIPDMYRYGIKADVVVVDPPRKGCDEALLDTLVSMRPERIVYVSCKPSTLARDLRYLADRGYMPVEVQPVDMFPWTMHTESVARIERVKG